MVIQKLKEIQALLEQDPPNVHLAHIQIIVAISELQEEYRKHEHALATLTEIDFDFPKRPVRNNDELLKEFGW